MDLPRVRRSVFSMEDPVRALLQIPDFLADIELLGWSKRDHNLQEGMNDVIAADYMNKRRTWSILQSHFNDTPVLQTMSQKLTTC